MNDFLLKATTIVTTVMVNKVIFRDLPYFISYYDALPMKSWKTLGLVEIAMIIRYSEQNKKTLYLIKSSIKIPS